MIPKLITFIVAAQYIVLHNSYDEHSREVVDQIPWNSSDQFCVIDWYRQTKGALAQNVHLSLRAVL